MSLRNQPTMKGLLQATLLCQAPLTNTLKRTSKAVISHRPYLTSAAYKRDSLFGVIFVFCRIIDRSENMPEPRSEEHLFTLFAEETYLSFFHSTL